MRTAFEPNVRSGNETGGFMRVVILLSAIAVLAGCNPYMAAVSAVSATYGAATDERSVGVQVQDTDIEAKLKASLLQSPVPGTASISAYCRQGVVVLTGVVAPNSEAGRAAVRLARETAGVRRVETFFVPQRISESSDLELEAKVKAALVEDTSIVSGRVDIAVYNGNVLLIGVAPDDASAERFVSDAQAVPGVVSVRSYIQLPQ